MDAVFGGRLKWDGSLSSFPLDHRFPTPATTIEMIVIGNENNEIMLLCVVGGLVVGPVG
jgi:hypothetical protein